ncbi:hypothetical protein GCM10022221_65090 [Actinocorallia aurea]
MVRLGGTRLLGLVTVSMDGEQGAQWVETVACDTVVPVHFDDYAIRDAAHRPGTEPDSGKLRAAARARPGGAALRAMGGVVPGLASPPRGVPRFRKICESACAVAGRWADFGAQGSRS